ncbi:hypothetical protein Tco_0976859 [Tanacetum coccineum]|uniref:Uncharacterized protein n=1 Tax=Tanacetum coccineum TaxID=301880 RepID=A0ABQ5EIN8_9ASTR
MESGVFSLRDWHSLVGDYNQFKTLLPTQGQEVGLRYDVSNELDTVYWGFLSVWTTFDIFQNIILIPYLEYSVLSPLDMAYWSLFFCGLLVSAGTDTPYLLDGYGVLVFRIVIFKISSFKLQNARLLLSFTNYSIITGRLRCKGVTKQIIGVIPKGLALRVVLMDLYSKDESGKGFKREVCEQDYVLNSRLEVSRLQHFKISRFVNTSPTSSIFLSRGLEICTEVHPVVQRHH